MFPVGEVNQDTFTEECAPKFANKDGPTELSLSLSPIPSDSKRVDGAQGNSHLNRHLKWKIN